MATLKEFEEALRQNGMSNALAILEALKRRDREKRSVAPARRVVGRKMTAELARSILDLHATTGMTQQEIAFRLGVNQGRVNEVIKRGKWLSADPKAPEALSRDRAMQRLDERAKVRRATPVTPVARVNERPVIAEATAPPTTQGSGERRAAELLLGHPGPVRSAQPPDLRGSVKKEPQPAAIAPKPLVRRPAQVPTSIVSAQLAFLDL